MFGFAPLAAMQQLRFIHMGSPVRHPPPGPEAYTMPSALYQMSPTLVFASSTPPGAFSWIAIVVAAC